MRIAHLSDLHLLSLEGAVPFRLLNKRITGYLNLRLHRQNAHRPFAARAAARALRDLAIDHVVITGDVTNLALEVEFDLVARYLEEDLGFSPDRVSIVPGNHDAYTRGAHRSERFVRSFAKYLTSDISTEGGSASTFPFVKLRGPVAFVGLCTAVPRPPLVASGELGRTQLARLEAILGRAELSGRMVVILQHHPIHNPRSSVATAFSGLADADAESHVLGSMRRGLLLHGHLHRRERRQLLTTAGAVDVFGATSATLIHENRARMAGFNVYEVDSSGSFVGAEFHCLVPETDRFTQIRESLPGSWN